MTRLISRSFTPLLNFGPRSAPPRTTRNPIPAALNKPEEWLLAIVSIDGETANALRYLVQPFTRAPAFAVTSVTCNLVELLAQRKSI